MSLPTKIYLQAQQGNGRRYVDFSELQIICTKVIFKLILRSTMAYCFVFQVISLLPVYLLQISYGMNTGYPAIITPQLEEPCSEFNITADQESWIGICSF